MEFASDNTSGAAPQVLAALNAANAGYAPSYGSDPIMARVTAQVRALFEAPDAAVYLVATGTAANALAAAILCPQWGALYCHGEAHVEVPAAPSARRTFFGRRHRLRRGQWRAWEDVRSRD